MNPSTDWSLTDSSTWLTILTIAAAVLSDIFHRSFAGYVPAAATVAAGLVVAGVALAKHHYAAALAAANSTVTSANSQLPATAAHALHPALKIAAEAGTALASAGAALQALSNPSTAAAAPTAAPVTVVPAAAPTAPPPAI